MTNNILDHFDAVNELEEEWRLFIGPNSDYYVQEWWSIRSGVIFSFNFYALIFGVFWLLFRKMYQPAVFYLSLFFAEGFLETIFIDFNAMEVSLFHWNLGRIILFSIGLALLGNWIFYNHAQTQMAIIKSRFPGQYHQKLSSNGGTSLIPIITLFLVIIASFFIQFYFLSLGIE